MAGEKPPKRLGVRPVPHNETSANCMSAFDSKAKVWEEYLSSPRGGLRVDLSLQYLALHLNLPADNLRALDAGRRRGPYAFALAERGYVVAGLLVTNAGHRVRQDQRSRSRPSRGHRVGAVA